MLERLGDLLGLLAVVLVGFLTWAALSPFEMLGWWAGWFGDKIYEEQFPPDENVRALRKEPVCYIIFLSGIGRVSGATFSYREQDFLRRLARALPGAVVIDDVFPYSVNNMALTGQPFFARMWRWALRRKLNGPKIAGYLINIRNIWQVMISADKRYGPLYNQATAEVLLHSLRRYDYPLERKPPVFVVGYSGAAQMAVGVMPYLKEWLNAPLYVISLGGIFSSDPGLLAVDHFYHIFGSADLAHNYGKLAPGRWPIFAMSEWNRARRAGKVSAIHVGPVGHTGQGGYLDAKSEFADGTSFMDRTVLTIADIVHRHLPRRVEGDARVNEVARPLVASDAVTAGQVSQEQSERVPESPMAVA